MAFAHPNKHDVFISYAWADNATGEIDGFGEQLKTRLNHLLAPPFDWSLHVFQDKRDIRSGSGAIDKQILNSIRESAVLVAFITDNYLNSAWCCNELRAWLHYFGRDGLFLVQLRPFNMARLHAIDGEFPLMLRQFVNEDDWLNNLLQPLSIELTRQRNSKDGAPTILIADAPENEDLKGVLQNARAAFERAGIRTIEAKCETIQHDSVAALQTLQAALDQCHYFFLLADSKLTPSQESQLNTAFNPPGDFRYLPYPTEAAEPKYDCLFWTLAGYGNPSGTLPDSFRLLRAPEAIEIARRAARSIHRQRQIVGRKVLIVSSDDDEMSVSEVTQHARPSESYTLIKDFQRNDLQHLVEEISVCMVNNFTAFPVFSKVILLYGTCGKKLVDDWLIAWKQLISRHNSIKQLASRGACFAVVTIQPPPKDNYYANVEGATVIQNDYAAIQAFVNA